MLAIAGGAEPSARSALTVARAAQGRECAQRFRRGNDLFDTTKKWTKASDRLSQQNRRTRLLFDYVCTLRRASGALPL